MFQLEHVITKFSVEYVILEDKYFENREMYKYPEMIKKLISSYEYPARRLILIWSKAYSVIL